MNNFAERPRFTELSDTVHHLLRKDGFERKKFITGVRTYSNPHQHAYLTVEPNARLKIEKDELRGPSTESRGTYVTFVLEGKVDESLAEKDYKELLRKFKEDANARLQSYGVKIADFPYPSLNGRKELRMPRILLEYNPDIKPMNVVLAVQDVKNTLYGLFSKYVK